MANESINNNVISKTNSGFPDYLDFDALRSSSIEYLSNLTGKIWTDYNVHDPGITILEMLCYAVLDLGFRTNLPAADIFASGENNFFTPAQILSCNPLTILDFRKMLIDIDGVKNAWLQVSEDFNPDSFCNNRVSSDNKLIDYINGLYHVYIEQDDLINKSKDDLLKDIKAALQSHRNFCEDFIDIFILCKLQIGICADIEIEKSADADEVYKNIVKSLNDFLSPSPQFYTLQQLLDKQKTIDEIFAGRPYIIDQSHGFVDTEEFEKIELKEEIHVSDVYKVLLSVVGVKTVRKLQLKLCDSKEILGNGNTWKYKIPANYIPELSTACSGFKFYKNGITVPVDFKKNEIYFKVNLNKGKVLQLPPYLDLAIPQGINHDDLADYYSIQNEFPRVYGIGPGGLSNTATIQRKTQALQLKGYLLFFDQLLANYLTQLKNIPALFSFSSPENDSQKHTYFSNQLNSVPDLDQLLLYNASGNNGNSTADGNVVALPVNKKEFMTLIDSGQFYTKDIEKILHPYNFKTSTQRDIVANLLQNDFICNSINSPTIAQTIDGCYFYYLNSSSEEITLVSKKQFESETEAKSAVVFFTYILTDPQNYTGYFNSIKGTFSFNIQLSIPSFIQYVQQIVENETEYQVRRDGFLNHLLSRFAEQFTDYAMLSYGLTDQYTLNDAVIAKKENFLTNYPDLSRNRGKAFDYTKNYNNDNISGFEKRVRAIAGVDNTCCRSLCNFEVSKYENQYSVKLQISGFDFFYADTSYEGLEDASNAVQLIFDSLSDLSNYNIEYINHELAYKLFVKYDVNHTAYYTELFTDQKDAVDLQQNLYKMFASKIPDSEVFVSKYLYKLQFTDYTEKVLCTSIESYSNEQEAFAASIANLRQVNDPTKWEITEAENLPSGKFSTNNVKRPEKFIDIEVFKIEINNNIIERPDKYTYEVLEKKNHIFKFIGLNEFNSDRQARSDCYRLLFLLVNINNYQIVKERHKYKIYILNNEQRVAGGSEFDSEKKAQQFCRKVCDFVDQHYYMLKVIPIANQWKFPYQLGFQKNNILLFESNTEFESKENAILAAQKFTDAINNTKLEITDGVYTLKNETGTVTCTFAGSEIIAEKESVKLNKANKFLALQQEINTHLIKPDAKSFEGTIEMDDVSKSGQYVYRLVDKDNLIAFHPASSEENANDSIKTLFEEVIEGYPILDICLGGDITEETADKKKNILYRYLIKCRNAIGPLEKDTILLKSIETFDSATAAEAAFTENYLTIVGKAMDSANYGPGKFISIDETALNDDEFNSKADVVVFIPIETVAQLGNDNNSVITALSKIARSYPIRMISEEFKSSYPMLPDSKTLDTNTCKMPPPKNVYYFILYNYITDKQVWQSVNTFNTEVEARQQFHFLLMLLRFKGNYYVEADYCDKYNIYIREVLAESTHRFPNETDAWGKDGIEKFVCIVQSQNGIRGYFNKNSCSYNYYVACDNNGPLHLCKYDTAEKRDKAIDLLYTSFKEFDTNNLFTIVTESGQRLLYGFDSKPLTKIYNSSLDNDKSDCELIFEILQLTTCDSNYIIEDGSYYLTTEVLDNDSEKVAEPYDATMPFDEWRQQMLKLAYYYPITVIRDENDVVIKFCIELKLPNFNTPDNDDKSRKPCGCEDGQPFENNDYCYIAWKSNCCFTQCNEAMDEYRRIQQLLADYNNYKPFFDCSCHSYGIQLQPYNDIVALNPQFYLIPDTACDAIERSKKLVNCEGLHTVEHILLRPRCPGDCACDYYVNRNFENITNCNDFIWIYEEPGNADDPEDHIRFVPGADPFSFIATIVLPAWPQRFRKKENRMLLENLINSEAPAHVLLRIIWLAPHDLCKFESLYKNWIIWLSEIETCKTDYSTCNFLDFLFKTDFECLGDCEDCLPCKEDIVPDPCFDYSIRGNSDTSDVILNQVNSLFGWQEMDCVDQTSLTESEDIPLLKDATPYAQEQIASNTKIDTTLPEPKPAILLKDKPHFVNGRLAQYKKNVAGVLQDVNDNPIAGKVNSMLSQNNPSPEKVSVLLDHLTNTQTCEEKGALSVTQKADLIKNLVWFYLDKAVFNEYDFSKIQSLASSFEKLRAANFDMLSLYNGWEPDEIQQFQLGVNIRGIKKLLIKAAK